MIDDTLYFSKADVGEFTLKNTDFHLGKLVDDLTTTFRRQAEDKDLEFKVAVAEEHQHFLVRASYLEIYNEEIRDLLYLHVSEYHLSSTRDHSAS